MQRTIIRDQWCHLHLIELHLVLGSLFIPGLVLQVTKIRNVSAPKINEESKTAPRMLKISLTDGKTTVHAVEMAKIEGVSLTTAPGTKIKLLKSVSLIRHKSRSPL